MIEPVEPRAESRKPDTFFCNNCSHDWHPARRRPARFASLDDLVARTGLRRDEIVTLADIGALNAFGYDRRSALWQAERAVRPAGELFTADGSRGNAEIAEFAESLTEEASSEDSVSSADSAFLRDPSPEPRIPSPEPPASSPHPPTSDFCPLRPMTESERIVADYAGTGLTVGRHPMALRREELAARGIMRAIDLKTARHGRRVRVAGMVITRQRPGTAKGFVFLTLEDETGVANIIVRPDLFARDRLVVIEEPFLIVDGILQQQDNVTSVRAENILGLTGPALEFDAHDFY